jgi:hypothetical protein
VRVLAWGLTKEDAETAVRVAGFGPSRAAWDFTRIDWVTDGACPIDIRDPKVIAADAGSGWAYAVYPGDADG